MFLGVFILLFFSGVFCVLFPVCFSSKSLVLFVSF